MLRAGKFIAAIDWFRVTVIAMVATTAWLAAFGIPLAICVIAGWLGLIPSSDVGAALFLGSSVLGAIVLGWRTICMVERG